MLFYFDNIFLFDIDNQKTRYLCEIDNSMSVNI